MIEKEVDLFNYLKNKYFDSLKKSPNVFDCFDCYNEDYYIELKCRLAHYDRLLIEKSKYDRLIEQSYKYKLIPIYINSTPKGIWAFKINELCIEWFERDMPKTTYFEDNDKVKKIVGFIDTNLGIIL